MSMFQQWQTGFPKGSLCIYLLVCLTSGQRMLSEGSWGLWVRCDRLARGDWNSSHYSSRPLWHQARCAGTCIVGGMGGPGTGRGTPHPSLKVTGWAETRTHQQLMYNPVWLAKRNRSDSWWHRSHSSWAGVLQKADRDSMWQRQIILLKVSSLHSLNKTKLPDTVPL